MRIYSIINEGKLVLMRNSIILNTLKRKAVSKEVNLNWWSLNRADGQENLGDYLSVVVVDYMLNRKGIQKHQRVSKIKHLYAIGSIIGIGYQDATIWGSGFLNGGKKQWRHFRKLDIRCVRGPKTRQVLADNGYECEAVYGDPAILMPEIYAPKREQTGGVLVIPHICDECDYSNQISMKTTDYRGVIDKIASAKLVISSSLHGVILAETYGVPAIVLKGKSTKMFKFEDYYLGTGRDQVPVASSLEEAMHMQAPCVPDFSGVRKQLIESFPYDLWR